MAIIDRRDTPLIADIEKEPVETTQLPICSFEQETSLNNLHHFTLLFKTLVNETRSTSYDIGSQSRVRIEKHISSARASEVMWLYKVHGEATVRDVWGKFEPRAGTVFDNAAHRKPPPQTHQTCQAFRPAPSKRQKPSLKSRVEQPLDDHEVIDRTLIPASDEEWKSWINTSDSADEEHDPKTSPKTSPLPLSTRPTYAAREYRAWTPEVASPSPDVTGQVDAVKISPTPKRKRSGITCLRES